MGTGGILSYQIQGNSENIIFAIKESVPGCKGPGTKGKQPRSITKVLKKKLSEKKSFFYCDSQKVGLEAAILERKRNSSLV